MTEAARRNEIKHKIRITSEELLGKMKEFFFFFINMTLKLSPLSCKEKKKNVMKGKDIGRRGKLRKKGD